MDTQLKIDTLAIGDELLCGRISDTNSTHVASEMLRLGIRLRRTTVIEDRREVIVETLQSLSSQTQLVVCFGGLGPTSDDLTAQAVAELVGCELVEDPAARARIEELCRVRNRQVTPQILKQAKYPKAAEPIPNRVGLAVGFWLDIGSCRFFFFPGVPEEMRSMISDSVVRYVSERVFGDREVLRWHRWKLIGVAESELQRHMSPIEAELPKGMWLGYQTKFPENHLTLYSRCSADTSPKEVFGNWKAQIAATVRSWVYTEDDKDLEQLVLGLLEQKKKKLVLVESCTGGLVARRLTEVPGSSKSFWGSFVSYQTDAKSKMLGVDLTHPDLSVAAETSRRLAHQALEKSGCDYVGAITGYMGPEGGTPTDPLGTIYISIGGKRFEDTRIRLVDLGRLKNQWSASTHFLNCLYQFLKGGP